MNYSTLVTEGSGPKLLYVLHGIFGSGRNWSSVIRQFVRTKPTWSARLIDLRQHGNSQDFDGPNTIEATANDLTQLAVHEHETPAAILGHSFGGKVALMYARNHGAALEHVWVVDSTPETRLPDGSAWQMLELIRRVPREFRSRDELVQVLTASRIPTATAQWMATNLHNVDGCYRWRFDFDALEEMLRDFFNTDVWDVLENPPGAAHIHMIKARESSVLSPAAVKRVEELSENGRVHLHVIDGGHWVNAENPEALLALLAQYM